jgi:hypothetical protein
MRILTTLVVFLMAATAQAVTPAQLCTDTVAKAGAKMMMAMTQAAAQCDAKRGAGDYPAITNCDSSLVDLVTPQETVQKFKGKILALRAAFTKKVLSKCAADLNYVDVHAGTPCSVPEGVATATDLAICIIYDGHGRIASKTQNIVLPQIPSEIPVCRAALGKTMIKWQKALLKYARVCGKADDTGGKPCDRSAIEEKLGMLQTKLRGKALEKCATADPTKGRFGGLCSQTFLSWDSALTCLFGATLEEAALAANLLYPGSSL